MVTAPTASGLYASAASFAQSALEAHHRGDHQRVAIDAGTALEHLTKACLASRSPALLTELKTGPNNWPSLVLLCGFTEGKPKQLRTVGLREARARVKTFFTSAASESDLALLIDLRDGVVHAALDEEVEERLLVAFVQQADATLAGMSKPRAGFWGGRLDVVNALLAVASSKVMRRVQVKLAAAKAAFADRYDEMPDEARELFRRMPPAFDETEEAVAECPACGSKGVAAGEQSIEVDGEYDEDGDAHAWAWVKFTPVTFSCPLCGLRLETQVELAAAGMPKEWKLPDIDVSEWSAREWDDEG